MDGRTIINRAGTPIPSRQRLPSWRKGTTIVGHDADRPHVLLLENPLKRQVLNHAKRTYPEECCGVLVGTCQRGRSCVTRTVEADNIAEGDRMNRYQIEWRTLLETIRATRGGEESVIGFYHSHPDGTTTPSKTDSHDAWLDCSYVIVGILGGRPTGLQSWRWSETQSPCLAETIIPL